MWHRKWGNLCIRPNIGVVVDDSGSQGFGQSHIPPMSTIPQVAVEEVDVPEFEKDGIFRGEKCEKHCES